MRKALVLALVCLVASVVLAQTARLQPLNVKTGLWQVTGTSKTTGAPPIPLDMQARMDQMTPEQRAKVEAMIRQTYGATPRTITYKKCVTSKELNTDPFSQPDQKCNWTVVNSTSSEMEIRGTSCAAGKNQGINTDVNMKIHALDSENVKASYQASMAGNGQNMNMSGEFTGKWLGATCPAGTD